MKLSSIVLTFLCLTGLNLHAGEGPKIFIESISQPQQRDSLLFHGKSTTEGLMPPASEIERILAPQCRHCVFVAKKERADYILTFSSGTGSKSYDWSVIDNAGDGKRIASKSVLLEANAYSNAIEAVKVDWAKKNGPELRVIKWELPENPEGIYEIKINQSEVGPEGAKVRLKIVKAQ